MTTTALVGLSGITGENYRKEAAELSATIRKRLDERIKAICDENNSPSTAEMRLQKFEEFVRTRMDKIKKIASNRENCFSEHAERFFSDRCDEAANAIITNMHENINYMHNALGKILEFYCNEKASKLVHEVAWYRAFNPHSQTWGERTNFTDLMLTLLETDETELSSQNK